MDTTVTVMNVALIKVLAVPSYFLVVFDYPYHRVAQKEMILTFVFDHNPPRPEDNTKLNRNEIWNTK